MLKGPLRHLRVLHEMLEGSPSSTQCFSAQQFCARAMIFKKIKIAECPSTTLMENPSVFLGESIGVSKICQALKSHAKVFSDDFDSDNPATNRVQSTVGRSAKNSWLLIEPFLNSVMLEILILFEHDTAPSCDSSVLLEVDSSAVTQSSPQQQSHTDNTRTQRGEVHHPRPTLQVLGFECAHTCQRSSKATRNSVGSKRLEPRSLFVSSRHR